MLSNPGLVLIAGSLVIPFLPRRWRGAWMVVLPVAAMALLWSLPEGGAGTFELFGLVLEPLRVDRLARLFATAFLIAAFLCAIYALGLRDRVQQTVIPLYGGAAIAAVLAGDLLTLFVFWEITGIASVFLVWSRRTGRSYRAGIRYLAAQVISGLLLLTGIVLRAAAGQGLQFDFIGTADAAGWLIMIAAGIKCGFPVLHAWLQDTYPEATIVGTVVLSSFTTKMAIYTLARGFEGTPVLIWIGAVMTVFPIFYAVIENDLRRVLAYSMINQLGFMVAGIGIGGELGINGASAHAFADIIFKGLLFMSMGAVLLRTGTANGSDLGGLYKSMPQTTVLCIVGAASISAFPLFSGFATKSMIMQAVGDEGLTLVWLLLLFASAGVFHHAGIKIPYFAFFAHDRGYRVQEAPLHMRAAMGLAAALCIGIGVVPGVLYGILPFPVDYVPYTVPHVVNQVQLLTFAALGFTILVRTGIYPPELRSVNIDADWIYRKGLPAVWNGGVRGLTTIKDGLDKPVRHAGERAAHLAMQPFQARGWLGAQWSSGYMVWWVACLLGLYLVFLLLF